MLSHSCGAEPNLDLVRNTPLAGPHGSPVTEYLETEEKGIYAIGDLAFYPDRIMGGMLATTAAFIAWRSASLIVFVPDFASAA